MKTIKVNTEQRIIINNVIAKPVLCDEAIYNRLLSSSKERSPRNDVGII